MVNLKITWFNGDYRLDKFNTLSEALDHCPDPVKGTNIEFVTIWEEED